MDRIRPPCFQCGVYCFWTFHFYRNLLLQQKTRMIVMVPCGKNFFIIFAGEQREQSEHVGRGGGGATLQLILPLHSRGGTPPWQVPIPYTLVRCCGSGSARIRSDLAVLDPDLYWEFGSGSRSMEIDQNSQKKPGFLSKRLLTFVSSQVCFWPIAYLKCRYIFHVKL